MPTCSADALILRTYRLGESDRLVVFLTRDRGKKRGVAKNARQSRRRFGGALEPMTYGRVSYVEREGRDLVRLEYVEPIRSPLSLDCHGAWGDDAASHAEGDCDDGHAALEYVGYFAELIDEWAQEADPNETLYRLGASSRLQMITRITSIGYDVGVYGTSVNLSHALGLARQLPAAIDSNLKPAAVAEKTRLKSISQVLINTLTDKISPNLGPTVAPVAAPNAGVESLAVNFASNAIDGDGSIVSTQWNFGDFTYSNAANPTHTYQCDGNYTATVDVVDNRGAVASGTATITVTSAGGPLTHACDVQPIFNRVCTGCHGSARGLSLTTCENLQLGSSPSPRPVVIPGDAANSRLVQRINSTTAPMPPIGGQLPAAEIAAITNWINSLNPADTNFCD